MLEFVSRLSLAHGGGCGMLLINQDASFFEFRDLRTSR